MNKETIEKMGQMRLYGMQAAFRECTEEPSRTVMTTDETIGHIVQNEWDDRRHRAVQRGIRAANFRYVADREGLDLERDRGLDKNLVDRIFTCGFIIKAISFSRFNYDLKDKNSFKVIVSVHYPKTSGEDGDATIVYFFKFGKLNGIYKLIDINMAG